VKAPAMTLRADARGRPPPEDTTIEARAVIRVDVDVPVF
jgi:hypothetical protein